MKKLEKITPWNEDFAKWYVDVIKQAEFMEYGPIKGTIYFKPNSFALWEKIQENLNKYFKQHNVKNVYFPLLIPQSFINKEKEHVKGFAPELLTITHAGEKKLAEELYVRPTSEVLFADCFKKELANNNQLPLIYNQWTSVLRWEKNTNPFLRTTEFLWQEGHTVHTNAEEAQKLARTMIEVYKDFIENYLAIPVIVGNKTERERFAGAVETYTVEAMMKDGKALQSGTSHYLGQNFSKSFDIIFKNTNNEFENPYQTSWGVSTRLIGGLIMTHGDDRGVIIPPKIAPVQIDILVLFSNKNPIVSKTAQQIFEKLRTKFTPRIDASDNQPGYKASRSEVLGTPLRIEVGPRDLEKNQVTLVRRDTLEKYQVDVEKVFEKVEFLLDDIQNNLYNQAKTRLVNNLDTALNYEEFKSKIAQNKFVIIPFEANEEIEEQIQAETGATTRCIPINLEIVNELKKINNKCFFTNKTTNRFVIFAKAY
ncbi:proline--tRNA ligase [Mycoplasma sp. 1654_15]|uniref:proline--tRNA ligase n=1 Tax=Mycoplasma sp. 1654_15 TaxID=2725994 RepID=UPI001449988D|nr:proline--tRNA ligase [Mycoplasma sp. 1654_15]QJB71133.1 proline--tRNA ligase [Mycoplasma sp. 1654_15]